MNETIINAGSIIGKDILNLENGTFAGKVQNLTVDASGKCIVGILVKGKGFLSGKNMIPFSAVKAFGAHAVTVTSLESQMAATGRDIVAMPVVTIDGTILGKVFDYAFAKEDGQIVEYVLANSLLKGAFANKGSLKGEAVKSIGKDVVIAKEGITENDLTQPEDDIYSTWQEIDDILADLDEENSQFDEDKTKQDKESQYEEQFDDITNRINKTIEEVADHIREIDTEELADKFKEQADKFGEEAKGLLSLIKEKLQNSKIVDIDLEDIKDELKQKVMKNDRDEENLADKLVEQLKDTTVAKPLLDAEGNVIVWPGQIIGHEEIKETIRKGKLQELMDLAAPFTENSTENDLQEIEENAGVFGETVENISNADKE